MRYFKIKTRSSNHIVPIGTALFVVVICNSMLIGAEPRINAFPSLYEDDASAEKSSSQVPKQTTITTPSKSTLNGVEFGKRAQTILPPSSPAQIIKSIAASSTPVWSSAPASSPTNVTTKTTLVDQRGQKTTAPATKNLVMQNLATGEIYMKRTPSTNVEQATVDGGPDPAVPKHWSSLENYLRMVRVSASQQQLQQQHPYYQTLSDEYLPSSHRDQDSSGLGGQGYFVQIARPNDPNGATLILPYPVNDLNNQQQKIMLPMMSNYQSDTYARQNSRYEDSLNAKRIESIVPSRTRDEISRLFEYNKYNSQYNNNHNTNNNNDNIDYPIYRPSGVNLQANGRDLNALDRQVQIPETHINRFPDPVNQQYHQRTFDRAFCHFQNQMTNTRSTSEMYKSQQQQQQHDLNTKRIDVDLTPNAYPSHMGIYNGSQPNSNNYLCGATWIHQSFAITLASCLHGVDNYDNLTIQAGEWDYINYTKHGMNPPIRRKIKSITVHPSYKLQSWKDNIALVQFDQPISPIGGNIYPACQQYSRVQLRAHSCWVPARNVTKTSYFDPDGDGETRDRLDLNMIELPIKLIPYDDVECQRETRIEAFNFANPGLICSNEYKQLKRRVETGELEILGSGVYCDEGGILNLVSMFHPAGYEPLAGKSDLDNLLLKKAGYASSPGLIDLSSYKQWIDSVIEMKDSRSQLSMIVVRTQNISG